ncbi:MAG: sigma-70 family RNA polymerase sigma factor [Flavobacteriales bacterium]|nr:sigma-70 family RNA polymerase sigma factor [Flavobacteriales bacterium]
MNPAEKDHHDIAAAKTDPACFAPLYERYFGDIFRFIDRRTSDRDLTADLTQQSFLKAMLGLERYEPRGLPFRAWLYRIALNELRMHWRKKKEVLIDMSYAEVRGMTEEMGLQMDETEMQRLSVALSRLDEERARLIELRYMDGLSFAELGQVLGVGEDAAKMRTHRVLGLLRTYLVPRS